ncbi:MAG: ATP-binding protein [Verrucomicrobiota bacterium]
MKESLRAELPPDLSRLACRYLAGALQQLPQLPNDVSSFISESTSLAAQYLQALLRGDRHFASKLILVAVQQGTPVRDIYLQVFERTQHEIGRLWQVNQISVAQEHYCTAATQQIMSQLYPCIFGSEKTRGTLVAACITGDLHEIGARMLCDFFEIDGWRTHYLGADVPAKDIIQTVVQYKPGVLAISATITYHVTAVQALVAAVRRAPECCNVKILVGGYPFKIDPDLWRNIGADGSANGAQEAVALADRLTSRSFGGVDAVETAPAIHLPDSEGPVEAGEDVPGVSSAAVKESVSAAEALQRREDRIFEDLSRANNELINAQREMARKNAEVVAARNKLEISEQRLAVATESAHIGIWDCDVLANKMVWDTRMCELYGIGEPGFSDTVEAWRKYLHPEDRNRVEADIAAALGGSKDYNTEFRVIWPSGEVRNIEAHGVVLRAGDGSPTRMIGVNWDITERLRARIELAREHELNRIKSRFVRLVSHEFRTPLCVINAAAALLGDYSDKMTGEERSERTREIQRAVERMTLMMEDLLLYETFESEKMECNTSPVKMEAICRESSSEALNHYRTHCPIDCIIETSAHEVFLDEKILRHILRNLLSNALKYSSDDQPVTLKAKRVAGNAQTEGEKMAPQGDHLQLLVSDAGIGIPTADLGKLYQPFHRGANVGNHPGAGIGLAIVKKFVDLHQGAIRVESTEGKGTSVWVWLPFASSVGTGLPISPAH